METHHPNLIWTLKGIAKGITENSSKGWKGPFNAIKEPVDLPGILRKKEKLRKTIKQIDINRARLRSKTYSPEQLKEWEQELAKTKNRRPALKFPGDPDKLAGEAPKRICPECRTLFYSMGEKGTTCFRCCLEHSHQMSRGASLASLWWHQEDTFNTQWGMQGIIDFLRNDIQLWWWNNNSNPLCHQALIIVYNSEDRVSRLSLSTLLKENGRCYTAVFDLARNGMVGLWSSRSCTTDVSKHKITLAVDPKEVAYILERKFEMLIRPWAIAL